MIREAVWTGLKEGRSGVAKTTLFDASGFPTKISAEVKDWDITDSGEPAEKWKDRGRHTKFAVGAAKQAIERQRCDGRHHRPDSLRRLSWAAAKATRTS